MMKIAEFFTIIPVYIVLVFLSMIANLILVFTTPPRTKFVHTILSIGFVSMLALISTILVEEFRLATIVVFGILVFIRFLIGK